MVVSDSVYIVYVSKGRTHVLGRISLAVYIRHQIDSRNPTDDEHDRCWHVESRTFAATAQSLILINYPGSIGEVTTQNPNLTD